MKFCVALKEAVSKIEIHQDFDKLDVVIDSKENSFSVNYVLIKKNSFSVNKSFEQILLF